MRPWLQNDDADTNGKICAALGDSEGDAACQSGQMSGLIARAAQQIRSNSVILRNSVFMSLGSASAAVLGVVYWWLAARSFPAAAVGFQSALISAMTFVGLLGEAGFGTMLVGEALGQGDRAAAMISAAVLAGTGATLILALPIGGLLFYCAWMTLPTTVLFVLGCALTGMGFVVDGALIGLLHGRWQLYRNTLLAVLKLGLLLVAVAMTRNGTAIILTWIMGLSISLAVVCGHASIRRVLISTSPNFRSLSGRMSVVVRHHALNLAAAAPTLIMPLVVTVCVGPAVNAAFYVGWMVLFIGSLVPASLTTVLFAVSTVDAALQRQRFRFSFLLSLGFSVVIAGTLALFSDNIMSMFNPAYPALVGSAVRLLGLGLLGGTVKQHYILLMRIRGSMMTAALWLGVGACLEISLAAAGGVAGGVDWLTVGWLVAVIVEVAFLLPPVLRFSRSAAPLRATGPISGKSLLRGMADKLIVSDGSSGSTGRIMSARTLTSPVSNELPTTGTGQ
jgi:O-antigen/teichoic acid export membrane protein